MLFKYSKRKISSKEFTKTTELIWEKLFFHKKEIDKKFLNTLLTDSGDVISTQGEIVPLVKAFPAVVSVSFVIAE